MKCRHYTRCAKAAHWPASDLAPARGTGRGDHDGPGLPVPVPQCRTTQRQATPGRAGGQHCGGHRRQVVTGIEAGDSDIRVMIGFKFET